MIRGIGDMPEHIDDPIMSSTLSDHAETADDAVVEDMHPGRAIRQPGRDSEDPEGIRQVKLRKAKCPSGTADDHRKHDVVREKTRGGTKPPRQSQRLRTGANPSERAMQQPD
jgi:hypothetical protein